MTDDDRPAFGLALVSLAGVFRYREVNDGLAEDYFAALRDLEIEALLTAMNLHKRIGKFFPVPSELRSYTTGGDLTAGEAYEGLVRVLRRSATGLPHDTPPFYRLLVMHLGGDGQVLHMDAGLMRKLVEDRLPDVIQVARVRGIAEPMRQGPSLGTPTRPQVTHDTGQIAPEVREILQGIGKPMPDAETEREQRAVIQEQARIMRHLQRPKSEPVITAAQIDARKAQLAQQAAEVRKRGET